MTGRSLGRGLPASRAARRWLLLVCAAALVLVQQTLHLGRDDLLGYALNDAMHVPLFVMLTVLIGRLLPGTALPLVMAAALLLAAATELLQMFSGRNASLLDLGLDAAGVAIGGLGLWAAGLLARRGRRSRAAPLLWLGVALGSVAVAAVRPAEVWLAQQARDGAFPTLLTPEAGLDGPLIATQSRWRLVTAPAGWPAMAGRPVLEVTWAAERYPAIVLREVVPDWGDFEQLVVDLLVADGAPITFAARVHYDGERPASSWLWRRLEPGAHQVRMPLDELLLPGRGGISRLVLHVDSGDAGRTTWLGPVRLEGSHRVGGHRPGAET